MAIPTTTEGRITEYFWKPAKWVGEKAVAATKQHVLDRPRKEDAAQRRKERLESMEALGLTPGEALARAPISFESDFARGWNRLIGREVSQESMRRQDERGDTQKQLEVLGLHTTMALEWLEMGDKLDEMLKKPNGFAEAWKMYGGMLTDSGGNLKPDEACFALLWGERMKEFCGDQIAEITHQQDDLQEQAAPLQEKHVLFEVHRAEATQTIADSETATALNRVRTALEGNWSVMAPAPDRSPQTATRLHADAKTASESLTLAIEVIDGTTNRTEATRLREHRSLMQGCGQSFEQNGEGFFKLDEPEQTKRMFQMHASAEVSLARAKTTLDGYQAIKAKYRDAGLSDDQIEGMLQKDENYQQARLDISMAHSFLNRERRGEFLVTAADPEERKKAVFDQLAASTTAFGQEDERGAKAQDAIAEAKLKENAEIIHDLDGYQTEIQHIAGADFFPRDDGAAERVSFRTRADLAPTLTAAANPFQNHGAAFEGLAQTQQQEALGELTRSAQSVYRESRRVLASFDGQRAELARSMAPAQVEAELMKNPVYRRVSTEQKTARQVDQAVTDHAASLFPTITETMPDAERQRLMAERQTVLEFISDYSQTLTRNVASSTEYFEQEAARKKQALFNSQANAHQVETELLGVAVRSSVGAESRSKRHTQEFVDPDIDDIALSDKKLVALLKQGEALNKRKFLLEKQLQGMEAEDSPHAKLKANAEKYGFNADDIELAETILEGARKDQHNLQKSLEALQGASVKAPDEQMQGDFIRSCQTKRTMLGALEDGAWDDMLPFIMDMAGGLEAYGVKPGVMAGLESPTFQDRAKRALEGPIKNGRISIFEMLAELLKLMSEQIAAKAPAAPVKASAGGPAAKKP